MSVYQSANSIFSRSSHEIQEAARAKLSEAPSPVAGEKKLLVRQLHSRPGHATHKIKARDMTEQQKAVLLEGLANIEGAQARRLEAAARNNTPTNLVKQPSLLVTYRDEAPLARVMSPTVAHGAFAKVRLLREPDGQSRCIRELRSVARRGRDQLKLQRRYEEMTHGLNVPPVMSPAVVQQLLRAGELQPEQAARLTLKTRHVTADVVRTETELPRLVNSPLQPSETVRSDDRALVITKWMHGDAISVHTASRDDKERAAAAVRLLRQGAAGLETIHRSGFLHRDIKPDNFLLDDNADFKVADFNLACRVDQVAPSDLVGTPKYMAPELFLPSEDSYGPPNDIFSLGVSALVMVTGQGFFLSGTRSLASMLQEKGDFLDFLLHAERDPSGNIDVHRLGHFDAAEALEQLPLVECAARAFFGYWASIDSATASFVLNRMLCAEPRERATAAEVKAFAEAHQPEGSESRAMADDAAARAVESRRREHDELMAILAAYERAYSTR